MMTTGNGMQDDRQARRSDFKADHGVFDGSLIKLIDFLQRTLDLEKQGVELGPIGHILRKPPMFPSHSMLGAS